MTPKQIMESGLQEGEDVFAVATIVRTAGVTAAKPGAKALLRDHDWEPAFLTAALATPAGFIGALGSQKTQTARIAHLAEKGSSEHDLKRVRGPIGLVPSLRDANLIAVSALAEVAQAFAYDQQKVIDA